MFQGIVLRFDLKEHRQATLLLGVDLVMEDTLFLSGNHLMFEAIMCIARNHISLPLQQLRKRGLIDSIDRVEAILFLTKGFIHPKRGNTDRLERIVEEET